MMMTMATTDKPMRIVSALAVRLLLPLSFSKKYSAENSAIMTKQSNRITMNLTSSIRSRVTLKLV